tara:strand:+ start:3431 stop:4696 length:1266 start_codon:yes stop_codon:yes gene_type:complete
MIKILNCGNKNYRKKLIHFLDIRRSRKSVDTSIVHKILKDVKKNKHRAVIKYEKRFSNNSKIFTSQDEINKSIKKLDPKIKKAIDFAYNRIFKFHALQKPKDTKFIDKYNNKIYYKNVPLQSIGIYVPANLPSTVLMCAIPAQIAKIRKIIISNPRVNGKLNPAVVYAAKKCGVSYIITCGGAQAIANLAYIQKVNKIFGPGNDFVARAKQLVFGDVGIEGMIAGPSEVTVLADNNSKIDQIITSIAAQSEHGINSQSILICRNEKFANLFQQKIFKEIKKYPRYKIIKKSLIDNGLIIIAKKENQIIECANIISPEHLEILTKKPEKYSDKIYNAGCIGIGEFSPVAASDYCVGSNHVLGVMGSAKFASGLNLSDFYKKISVFKLSKKGVAKVGKFAIQLSDFEDLTAHSKSIKSRMRRK